MSIQASQNDTLSRVNRANEAVWLRQGAPGYIFLWRIEALVRLSVHPSRSEGLRGRDPTSLSPPCSLQKQHEERGRRTSRWSERLTWHAVSVDKNVTRTKLTSLSRSFRALDVGLAEIARSSYSPGARREKRGNTADWIRMFSATNYSHRSHSWISFPDILLRRVSSVKYLYRKQHDCRDIWISDR